MTRVREWKPGDVAITDGPGERLPITFYERDGALLFSNGHGYQYPIRSLASNARPLVVIDPEDREQVERLTNALLSKVNDSVLPFGLDLAQAALREFADPFVKPEEPTGWLAAVVDDVGDKWVRDGMSGDRSQSGHWWNHTVAAEKNYDGLLRADWHAINAVKVLTDGIPA